jgi:hypothetical protein
MCITHLKVRRAVQLASISFQVQKLYHRVCLCIIVSSTMPATGQHNGYGFTSTTSFYTMHTDNCINSHRTHCYTMLIYIYIYITIYILYIYTYTHAYTFIAFYLYGSAQACLYSSYIKVTFESIPVSQLVTLNIMLTNGSNANAMRLTFTVNTSIENE